MGSAGGGAVTYRARRLLMAAGDQPSPWWSAARHADRKPFLLARAAITKAVRGFFD